MYKKIIKAEGHGVNEIEVSLGYSLGGMNYFTGKTERRGYYLHVQPQERKAGCISFVGFSGAKALLKEVKRQSVKAEKEAEALIPEWEETLIKTVCERSDIVLA